jgi:DNA-directed RNA polymerase specialized sigma24 family protein
MSEKVLDRFKQGDRDAWAELDCQYRPAMRRVAERILNAHNPRRDEAVAGDGVDDIVDDVFVELWERRETLEVHDSLAAYLNRASRNRAVNTVKRRDRDLSLPAFDTIYELTSGGFLSRPSPGRHTTHIRADP